MMISSIKRKRPPVKIESQSQQSPLSSLSLRLKLKELLTDIHASGFDATTIDRKFDAMIQQLVLLSVKGMECEIRSLAFLELAQVRIRSILQTQDPSTLSLLSAVPLEQRWRNIKQIVALAADRVEHPVQIVATAHDATIDDIELLVQAMRVSRNQGIAQWHRNEMHEAVPHLLAADRYMKQILLKMQQINIDQAMVENNALDVLLSSKKRRTEGKSSKTVRFSDAPAEILGEADAELDRRPICATKPTKVETLLIRAAREFPLVVKR